METMETDVVSEVKVLICERCCLAFTDENSFTNHRCLIHFVKTESVKQTYAPYQLKTETGSGKESSSKSDGTVPSGDPSQIQFSQTQRIKTEPNSEDYQISIDVKNKTSENVQISTQPIKSMSNLMQNMKTMSSLKPRLELVCVNTISGEKLPAAKQGDIQLLNVKEVNQSPDKVIQQSTKTFNVRHVKKDGTKHVVGPNINVSATQVNSLFNLLKKARQNVPKDFQNGSGSKAKTRSNAKKTSTATNADSRVNNLLEKAKEKTVKVVIVKTKSCQTALRTNNDRQVIVVCPFCKQECSSVLVYKDHKKTCEQIRSHIEESSQVNGISSRNSSPATTGVTDDGSEAINAEPIVNLDEYTFINPENNMSYKDIPVDINKNATTIKHSNKGGFNETAPLATCKLFYGPKENLNMNKKAMTTKERKEAGLGKNAPVSKLIDCSKESSNGMGEYGEVEVKVEVEGEDITSNSPAQEYGTDVSEVDKSVEDEINELLLRHVPGRRGTNQAVNTEYDTVDDVQEVEDEVDTFTCSVCTKTFYTVTDLHRHTYVCDFNSGSANVSQINELKETNNKNVRIRLIPYPGGRFAPTSTSGSETMTLTNTAQTSTARTFTARSRTRTTSDTTERNKTKILARKRNFNCGMCGKSFDNRFLMQRHMKIHSREKDFQCKVCGKCFTYRHGLTTHLGVHSEDRPYKCDVCPADFKHFSNLHKHKRSHGDLEKEKKYKCHMCPSRFYENYHLQRHIDSHIPQRTLQCELCDQAFARTEHLKVHIKRCHNGNEKKKNKKKRINLMLCSVCGQVFSVKKHLRKHMQMLHPGVDFDEDFLPQPKDGDLNLSDLSDDEPAEKIVIDEDEELDSEDDKKAVENLRAKREIKCTECDRAFRSDGNLRRHMRLMHDQESD